MTWHRGGDAITLPYSYIILQKQNSHEHLRFPTPKKMLNNDFVLPELLLQSVASIPKTAQ